MLDISIFLCYYFYDNIRGFHMNILRYYEAKRENQHIVDLFRDLEQSGRACSLPGALGLHYRKFDKNSPDYDYFYTCDEYYDKYHIDLLTCSNTLNGYYHPANGDVRITGSAHYCRHNHFCAICGTKEARRVSSQLAFNFWLNENNNYEYYMLTLTLPNFKEGFRQGFDIYNKTLSSVLSFLDWAPRESFNTLQCKCKGVFASREVTYNRKDNTWHPHIHIILAYEKGTISDVKISKKGYIKSGKLNAARPRDFSVTSVMNVFIKAIHKKFPDYLIPVDRFGNEFLNCDLRCIDDIENSVNELCKYFIDYRCFCDSDTLFTYLKDSYRLTKYTKRGCFGWDKRKEELWNKWLDAGRPTQNSSFMELKSDKYIYFGERIGEYEGRKYSFPVYYRKSDVVSEAKFFYDSDKQSYCITGVTSDHRIIVELPLNELYLHKLFTKPRPYFNRLLRNLIQDPSKVHVLSVLHKKIE